MKIVELKNVPGLDENTVVKIWKLNYGLKQDLQSKVSKVSIDVRGRKKVDIDLAAMKLYRLVFGIYECEKLGIKPPRNVISGFADDEINERLRIIRGLDDDTGEYIFDKITELENANNKTVEEIATG